MAALPVSPQRAGRPLHGAERNLHSAGIHDIILAFFRTIGAQTMTTSITFRTDAELKAEVEDILEDIGMNMSTAFNCFLAKIRDVGGIPFTLTRKSKHQRLVDAYNEAKEVANDPNAPTCTDPDKIEEFMLA